MSSCWSSLCATKRDRSVWSVPPSAAVFCVVANSVRTLSGVREVLDFCFTWSEHTSARRKEVEFLLLHNDARAIGMQSDFSCVSLASGSSKVTVAWLDVCPLLSHEHEMV